MRVEHIAIWTNDLERLRDFYERYFGARSCEKYTNPRKRFESYFLTFDSGARVELMSAPDLDEGCDRHSRSMVGYAHMAFSVGSEIEVDELTERLRRDGYEILDGPRRTGDGYYESVALDPDGNRIELTV